MPRANLRSKKLKRSRRYAERLSSASCSPASRAQLAWEDMLRIARNYDFAPTLEVASQQLVRKTFAVRRVAELCIEVTGGAGFFHPCWNGPGATLRLGLRYERAEPTGLKLAHPSARHHDGRDFLC